jgi:hypothetical protein
MFDIKEIQKAFVGLIGVRSSADRSVPAVMGFENSDSGYYINDAHPLLTISNLAATCETSNTVTVATFLQNNQPYKENDLVEKGEVIYRSLADDNSAPVTDTSKWVKTNVFSEFLRITYQAAITKVMRRLVTEKTIADKGKRLVNNIPLFFAEGSTANSVSGRFVGLRFWPQGLGLAPTLHKIGLQLKNPQADFKLYVYASDKNEPEAIKTVSYTNSGRMQWFEVALQLRSNVTYILGYYESDLSAGNASIATRRDLTNGSDCSTCNARDTELYNAWSGYVSLEPIQIESAFLDADNVRNQIWMEDNVQALTLQNFGLNMNLSVYCDLTESFIQSKGVFSDVILEQWKIILLEKVAFMTRINPLAEKVSSMSHFALHDPNNRDNPFNSLDQSFAAVRVDFSGLNPICLPCESAQAGVETGSMWD